MSVSNWRKRYSKFIKRLPVEARSNPELAIAAFLKYEKRQLIKTMSNGNDRRIRANALRSNERRRTKILKGVFGKYQRRINVRDPELLLFRKRNDLLRDSLCPKYNRIWKPITERIRSQKEGHIVLKDFSLIRNPVGTMKQINNLVEISANALDARIDFIDEQCDDVSPYLILAALLPSMPPIFTGGSINSEVAAVLESVGLDNVLNVHRVHRKSESKYPVLPFKMAVRNPPRKFRDINFQLKPQNKEIVADRFCDATEKWLSQYDLELTSAGVQSLINSITEALDNAERHGQPSVGDNLGDWSLCGFSRLVTGEVENPEEIKRLECSFAIVNTGTTISDSLKTADMTVLKTVSDYRQQHQRSSNEELLNTIAAMQDGITRVPEASAAKRGGVGLLELADLVSELGQTDQTELKSRYTVLSGSSCLRITAPYDRGISDPGTDMRSLWFNNANSDKEAPDSKHAFTINERFAGTIITAWFCVDPEFLKDKLDI